MKKLFLFILLALPTTYVYAEEIPTMPTIVLPMSATHTGVSEERANEIYAKVDTEVAAKIKIMNDEFEAKCLANPDCVKIRKRAAFARRMNQLGITDGLRAYNHNREVDAIIHSVRTSPEYKRLTK